MCNACILLYFHQWLDIYDRRFTGDIHLIQVHTRECKHSLSPDTMSLQNPYLSGNLCAVTVLYMYYSAMIDFLPTELLPAAAQSRCTHNLADDLVHELC